jgi:flagellar assembly protein FliH
VAARRLNLSPKIIKKGKFDPSNIRKFDSELAPRKISVSESQHLKPPKFEKNIHHAEKVAIFKDAENQAREIVENAKKTAESEAVRIKKEAFEKGYEEGMAKAAHEGKVYISDAVKSLSALIKELASFKKALLEDAEKQLAKLSVLIANKIILSKLDEDDEIIVNVAKKAIKALVDRETLTINLNPKDVEVMKREKVSLMQEIDGIKKLTIIEDESILRGGCYIETESSEVDARIDKQLGIIDKTLERK